MQLFALMLNILLLALTNTMLKVSANPLAARDYLPEGYKMGKMGFHGDVAGHEITYKGTIEEVLAYAEAKYPGVTNALVARDDVPLVDTSELTSSNITARSGDRACGEKKDCPLCLKWGWAFVQRIQQGISFLNKVTATCNTDGKTCVRISCSWHSAIYLCNDMEEHIELPCNWISTFAQDIIDDRKCRDDTPEIDAYRRAVGQQWAKTKPYNSYIGQASC
ncbi:uncharacterized protein RSE6_00769 [Rhynchosporium secalis]|uniref:Secreted protein n=1 Tax=Rhynchosporium secalis TaxID=38038 RepID=A0A1E1LW53_RHYSE|nr:uncharacterized protein RSE6_00769 [Rhynchosporium secalis]